MINKQLQLQILFEEVFNVEGVQITSHIEEIKDLLTKKMNDAYENS